MERKTYDITHSMYTNNSFAVNIGKRIIRIPPHHRGWTRMQLETNPLQYGDWQRHQNSQQQLASASRLSSPTPIADLLSPTNEGIHQHLDLLHNIQTPPPHPPPDSGTPVRCSLSQMLLDSVPSRAARQKPHCIKTNYRKTQRKNYPTH